MDAAYPILRARDNYPNILLSYSALAHSFCRHNSPCSHHQPIQILSRLYEKFFNLTGCVTKQRKTVDQVLPILLALIKKISWAAKGRGIYFSLRPFQFVRQGSAYVAHCAVPKRNSFYAREHYVTLLPGANVPQRNWEFRNVRWGDSYRLADLYWIERSVRSARCRFGSISVGNCPESVIITLCAYMVEWVYMTF